MFISKHFKWVFWEHSVYFLYRYKSLNFADWDSDSWNWNLADTSGSGSNPKYYTVRCPPMITYLKSDKPGLVAFSIAL